MGFFKFRGTTYLGQTESDSAGPGETLHAIPGGYSPEDDYPTLVNGSIVLVATGSQDHINALTAKAIKDAIEYYRSVAPDLLVELYVENTMAGITTAQSDQMFDDYSDVLDRIREGAFPTAVHRLDTKTPSGFVTQTLIDAWKAKIESYMP